MPILLVALLATAAPVTTPPIPTPKPATANAVARPSRDQVMAAVRAEWPKYDAGNKGRLTPLEFSTWVMKSHGGIVAPRTHAGGIAPVSAMNASATAFARADANHDGGVTPEEMARFLTTPPAPTALSRAKTTAKPDAARSATAAAAAEN